MLDFECYTEKIDTCYQDEGRSFTNKYQKHKPSGFCYLIKCFDNAIFEPKLVSHTAESPDEDIPKMFMESLESDIKEIYDKFKLPKNPRVSEDEKIAYENATHCHICGLMIGHDKVLDHCHLTGKYRGAAHEECNLNYKVPKFVPVIFHNLSGYDGHLFVRNIEESKGKVDCIPINDEKYISFTKEIVVDSYKNKEGKRLALSGGLGFIDSFRFMAAGLRRLVDNLPKSSLVNVTSWYERVMSQKEKLKHEERIIHNILRNADLDVITMRMVMEEFYRRLDRDAIMSRKEIRAFVDGILPSYLQKEIHNDLEEDVPDLQLLTRKGVFPYDWLMGLISSVKLIYHQRMSSTLSSMMLKYRKRIINMLKMCGKPLGLKTSGNITIFTLSWMCYCWRMSSRTSEVFVGRTMIWIQLGITLHLDWHGTQP